MNVLLKYINLMDKDLKYKFYTLIALLFFGGIMELFGLAMIIPIIKSIIEPNDIFKFINFKAQFFWIVLPCFISLNYDKIIYIRM